jgi:hypothetical protein
VRRIVREDLRLPDVDAHIADAAAGASEKPEA